MPCHRDDLVIRSLEQRSDPRARTSRSRVNRGFLVSVASRVPGRLDHVWRQRRRSSSCIQYQSSAARAASSSNDLRLNDDRGRGSCHRHARDGRFSGWASSRVSSSMSSEGRIKGSVQTPVYLIVNRDISRRNHGWARGSIMRGAVPDNASHDDLRAAKGWMNDVDETDVLVRMPRADLRPRHWRGLVGGESFGRIHASILPCVRSVSSFGLDARRGRSPATVRDAISRVSSRARAHSRRETPRAPRPCAAHR